MSIVAPNRARPAFPPLIIAAVFALAAAIIPLGVVGLVSAQASPAAPTGVTVLSSGEGFVINWEVNDATSHWVAWMSNDDYETARDAGDWTDALTYDPVPSGETQHVISSELLVTDADYWIIVGSVSGASAVAWGSWHRETALFGTKGLTDDELTQAYVMDAIAYYDANGRDATIAHYRSAASVSDERSLTLLDADTSILLVYRTFPVLQDQYVGPGTTYPGFQRLIESATAAGAWVTDRGINPVTKQEEPRRNFVVLHDGLVFYASHSVLVEDVAKSTQEYVNRAIAKYDSDGLQATIAYYDSQDSLEGQFYLFLIGADDLYLAHPIFPHLKGTDIKDVVGSDGQRLGEEIAQATEEGIWVEYLWPHPVTRREQQKVTWAVRHDGLIFVSGYYVGNPETRVPPWQDVADPERYTVDYVNRAIEKYERDGLESMLNYYNSVASFEGQWYLFATDENDIYHVHPLVSGLIGTDIKDVVGSDGYELGKALAAARDRGEGVWVEYLWPHPVTLQEVPKKGYAVRHDGMLFASGYYPQVADPAGETKAYVQAAIDYYKDKGLDATIAHYNSDESIEGQWSLTLADEKNIVRVAALTPNIIGRNLNLGAIGRQIAAATEEGLWVSSIFPNTRSSETLYAHTWAIRYDGLLFASRYYDDRPNVPAAAKTDDQLTREYVEAAIAYYDANGLDATIAFYRDPNSEGRVSRLYGRVLRIIDVDTQVITAFRGYDWQDGWRTTDIGPGDVFSQWVAAATPEGYWAEGLEQNPGAFQETPEPRRNLFVRHDGLVFTAGHSILRENVAQVTQDYVQRAIDYYESNGRKATVEHYNGRESVDGPFYLFLMDENDIYLVHPINPSLRGTDIKEVVGIDGQELGKEIAQATPEGIWVQYLWPNPVSQVLEDKYTWAIRHDGLIFASGYYAGGDETGERPAWLDAAPEDYTKTYVANAIARYERDGRDDMVTYYNSVASFEDQWYMFIMDANDNDRYIVHPLFSHLIGTDVKDLPDKDSEGNDLGRTIAGATEEGIWVEYDWPHPRTLAEGPKVSWVVRHDGLIFASGYYPEVADPDAYTQAYTQQAIDMYKSEGIQAVINHYSSPQGLDQQWYLILLDEDGVVLVAVLFRNLVGQNLLTSGFLAASGNAEFEEGLKNTPEAGHWLEFQSTTPLRVWAIRYDGYIFAANYLPEQ